MLRIKLKLAACKGKCPPRGAVASAPENSLLEPERELLSGGTIEPNMPVIDSCASVKSEHKGTPHQNLLCVDAKGSLVLAVKIGLSWTLFMKP